MNPKELIAHSVELLAIEYFQELREASLCALESLPWGIASHPPFPRSGIDEYPSARNPCRDGLLLSLRERQWWDSAYIDRSGISTNIPCGAPQRQGGSPESVSDKGALYPRPFPASIEFKNPNRFKKGNMVGPGLSFHYPTVIRLSIVVVFFTILPPCNFMIVRLTV